MRDWSGARRWAPIALLATGVGVLAWLSPLAADDFCHALGGVRSVVAGTAADWIGWNGRLVGQATARALAQLAGPAYALTAALGVALLAWLVLVLARGPRFTADDALVAVALLWFGIPAFGEALLWRTGAGNYLWTTVAALAYLVATRRLLAGTPRHEALAAAAMLPLGLIAGCTNENTAPVAGLLAVGMVVSRRRSGHRARPAVWIGLAGLTAGFLLMVLSPGHHVRLLAPVVQAVRALPFAARLARFLPGLLGAVGACWPGLAALVGAWALARRRGGVDQDRTQVLAFAAAWALGIAALVLAPTVPARALTGPAVFLAVAATSAVAGLRGIGRTGLVIVRSAVGTCLVVSFAVTLGDYAGLAAQVARRGASLERERAEGRDEIVLDPIVVARSRHMFYGAIADVTRVPSNWVNECWSSYHGVRSARTTSVDEDRSVDELWRGGPIRVGPGVEIVRVAFSRDRQRLVIGLATDDGREPAGFLDVRFSGDGTPLGRRAVDRLRRALLPASDADEVEYPHDLLRKVAIFYSFTNQSLRLEPAVLTPRSVTWEVELALEETFLRIETLYVGWRPGHSVPFVLHRVVPPRSG